VPTLPSPTLNVDESVYFLCNCFFAKHYGRRSCWHGHGRIAELDSLCIYDKSFITKRSNSVSSASCREQISGCWKVNNIDNIVVVLAPAEKRVESGTISSRTLTGPCW